MFEAHKRGKNFQPNCVIMILPGGVSLDKKCYFFLINDFLDEAICRGGCDVQPAIEIVL
jgi:hypothetical protein